MDMIFFANCAASAGAGVETASMGAAIRVVIVEEGGGAWRPAVGRGRVVEKDRTGPASRTKGKSRATAARCMIKNRCKRCCGGVAAGAVGVMTIAG